MTQGKWLSKTCFSGIANVCLMTLLKQVCTTDIFKGMFISFSGQLFNQARQIISVGAPQRQLSNCIRVNTVTTLRVLVNLKMV